MITSKSFFFFALVCVWITYACSCVWAHMCMCKSVCVCAPKVDVACLSQLFSTLYIELWPLTLPQSPLNWMVCLGILSQGCLVSAYQIFDLQVGHHVNLAFAQVVEIWSQSLKLTQASACPLNHLAVCGKFSYDLFHPNAPVFLWDALKYCFISLVDEEIQPQTEAIYIW